MARICRVPQPGRRKQAPMLGARHWGHAQCGCNGRDRCPKRPERRNPDAASKLRCLAQDTGGTLNVVAMDVTDAQSVRNAATQLKDVAIDVLINSAGIAGASGQKTGNVDYVSWAHVLNVNTMGPLRVVESFSGRARDRKPVILQPVTRDWLRKREVWGG